MKRIVIIFAAVLLVMPVRAQDISRQKERKEQLEAEISRIDEQLGANRDKRKQSINTLILTRKKRDAREKLIAGIDEDIRNYDNSISDAELQITRLNSRLDTLRKYHTRLVQGAYKTRDSRIWFMYILSSKDVNQGLRRWSYLKNLSNAVKKQADEIRSTEADLQQEKSRLEQLKSESMLAKAEREKEKAELTAEEKRINSMVAQLSREEKSMKRDLQKKQKEVEKLNKEIERILAEAVRQQKENATEMDYALSAKFGENKGKLPWPVRNGVVIQKFGQTYHPVFKNLKLPYNNGINISASAGSNATSVFDGIVKQVLVLPGYDQCVLVQHGEYFTFYCKLKRVYVKTGDKLRTGDRIGQISTNDDGNAELHFQLWKGTAKQNPESWLR